MRPSVAAVFMDRPRQPLYALANIRRAIFFGATEYSFGMRAGEQDSISPLSGGFHSNTRRQEPSRVRGGLAGRLENGGVRRGSDFRRGATSRRSRETFRWLTRIAAPVGQARTHAGPPERSLHMSHLTAFFAWSLLALWRSSPGSSVTPSSSHASRLGRRPFGSMAAIWITP